MGFHQEQDCDADRNDGAGAGGGCGAVHHAGPDAAPWLQPTDAPPPAPLGETPTPCTWDTVSHIHREVSLHHVGDHPSSHPSIDVVQRAMGTLLEQRNAALRHHADPLPGSQPYDNLRPINIPARLDGRTLYECVCLMYPQIDPSQWQAWFSLGQILHDSRPARRNRQVRGGEQFWHSFPDTVEPDVNAAVELIWEDPFLVGLCKPAPLPVHPCGRFNRNTLTFLLDSVYGKGETRLVHRLDANTSGVMVLARSKQDATALREQFENNLVQKRYLARILGHPGQDRFSCDARIGRERHGAGGRRLDPLGLQAMTEFRVVERDADGTSLVEAIPRTGRTNQIRIHLWSLGMPVAGDPTYLPNQRYRGEQTLTNDCPGMCLHASSLTFLHPRSKQPMQLGAPPPIWAQPIVEIPDVPRDR